MNGVEKGRHINQMLSDIGKLRTLQGPEAVLLWDQVISVATILKTTVDQEQILEELTASYKFTSTDDISGWKILSHTPREITRAEAINFRNIFAVEGLVRFRVKYTDNGYINWIDDSFDILADMRQRWGTVWNVWRSPSEIYHLKPNSEQPTIPKEVAEGLSRQLKNLYPMVSTAVYYGEGSQLSIRS